MNVCAFEFPDICLHTLMVILHFAIPNESETVKVKGSNCLVNLVSVYFRHSI